MKQQLCRTLTKDGAGGLRADQHRQDTYHLGQPRCLGAGVRVLVDVPSLHLNQRRIQ